MYKNNVHILMSSIQENIAYKNKAPTIPSTAVQRASPPADTISPPPVVAVTVTTGLVADTDFVVVVVVVVEEESFEPGEELALEDVLVLEDVASVVEDLKMDGKLSFEFRGSKRKNLLTRWCLPKWRWQNWTLLW